jgi:hypothetical protein
MDKVAWSVPHSSVWKPMENVSSLMNGRMDAGHEVVTAVTGMWHKYLIMSPRWGSTPRLTDWLTVSRNVTLTLTLTLTHVQYTNQTQSNRFHILSLNIYSNEAWLIGNWILSVERIYNIGYIMFKHSVELFHYLVFVFSFINATFTNVWTAAWLLSHCHYVRDLFCYSYDMFRHTRPSSSTQVSHLSS